MEVEILKAQVIKEHVHLFVSCSTHVSLNYQIRRIKGRSSRRLLRQFRHLNKECRGRHLWAQVLRASSDVITAEAFAELIRTQDVTKEDGDFEVDDE